MKVILDMAISLNGMIAREDGSEDFLPYEGWVEFVEQAKRHNNIVIGRETYEKVTSLYKDHNFNDVPVEHKVIITRSTEFHSPEGYVVVHSPVEAVDYLKQKGIDIVYLVGGGVLNAEFVKQNLVTDIHLTVSPFILGKGRPFLALDDFESPLTLQESRSLSNGRLRLLYTVNEPGQ
jgi:dihydrofolate reductase